VETEHDPAQQSTTWRHDDITLVLWFYATITDELYDVVMTPLSTAYQVWTTLHRFFRDNQPGRAIHLSTQFRSTVQGDLSITDYCRRLKNLFDTLADVDEPVTDRTLTLQLIRGLNRRYQVMATVLPMQIPFPTFVQARSRLLLEEICIAERDRTTNNAALVIGNGNGNGNGNRGNGNGNGNADRGQAQGNGNSDRGQAPAGDNRNGGRGNRGGRGRGRGRGRGNDNGGGNGGRGQQQQPVPQQLPWMGYFAPWGSPLPQQWRSQWVPPNAAGILGPRPGNPNQAYPMIFTGPPQQ
jgi:hypothetical protein